MTKLSVLQSLYAKTLTTLLDCWNDATDSVEKLFYNRMSKYKFLLTLYGNLYGKFIASMTLPYHFQSFIA
jgi:hypothetical protein